ncbi:MAG: hypothetical protein C5B60_06595 [Chloroflexi bacterium]|nr:MAG: hypothetical protein C5B60_06595 [Chloroflexota bacterium]
MNDEAELPIAAASGLLSTLRVNMRTRAGACVHATPSLRQKRTSADDPGGVQIAPFGRRGRGPAGDLLAVRKGDSSYGEPESAQSQKMTPG